jgi:hypothetical protein
METEGGQMKHSVEYVIKKLENPPLRLRVFTVKEDQKEH